jgi:hypothetical protein
VLVDHAIVWRKIAYSPVCLICFDRSLLVP